MATQQETTIICLPFREEKNSVRRSGIAQCRVFPETFPVRPAITGHSTEKITRSVIRNRVTRAPRDRVYGISDLDRKLIFEVNISVPFSRDDWPIKHLTTCQGQ